MRDAILGSINVRKCKTQISKRATTFVVLALLSRKMVRMYKGLKHPGMQAVRGLWLGLYRSTEHMIRTHRECFPLVSRTRHHLVPSAPAIINNLAHAMHDFELCVEAMHLYRGMLACHSRLPAGGNAQDASSAMFIIAAESFWRGYLVYLSATVGYGLLASLPVVAIGRGGLINGGGISEMK